MPGNISKRKFTDPKLNRYDVMQHVRNIYDILGITNPETFESNSGVANIVSRIDQIDNKSMVGWKGTMEEYKRDRAAGLIADDTVCAITDDYYEPNK